MRSFVLGGLLSLFLIGCAQEGGFDMQKALVVGGGVLQATTLEEQSVVDAASLSAEEMDKTSQLAPPEHPYSQRLDTIIHDLHNYDGLALNFRVYLTTDVNAFAMADGTVRVYSGLLDAMPDDQVLAVIGHEIGHVKLKHSYNQLRQHILTDTAFKAAVSVGGTLEKLTSSQLGQLGQAAITAHFSREDELEADRYALTVLKKLNRDPLAMKRAIQTLEKLYGEGGGFLSSHPSNPERIRQIELAAARL
ncbi:MAG: M48 family metallopeptidase [Desulfuromonadaceae bacterium]|nr:M48 family metallopeptidase [Desulfuromonadaceae bacterium]